MSSYLLPSSGRLCTSSSVQILVLVAAIPISPPSSPLGDSHACPEDGSACSLERYRNRSRRYQIAGCRSGCRAYARRRRRVKVSAFQENIPVILSEAKHLVDCHQDDES